VQVDGLNLRAKPAAGAKVVKVLEEGDELELVKRSGSWYLVWSEDPRKSGWVTVGDKYTQVKKK
jgi:uncharacterized protein YgiM (DUF1202 family)